MVKGRLCHLFRGEEKDPIKDCYFCKINLKGINLKGVNLKNKHHAKYSHVPSAIRPISHGPDLPVSVSDRNLKYGSNFEPSDMTLVAGDDAYISE